MFTNENHSMDNNETQSELISSFLKENDDPKSKELESTASLIMQ